MLLNPLIWWACIGAAAALGAAGVAVMLWGARLRRGGERGEGGRGEGGRAWRVSAGIGAVVIAVAGVVGMYAYGPWWRHAPTGALVRAFPTYAPDAQMDADPVAAELRQRIGDWAMAREDRVRLAAVCGEMIRDPAHPWPMGAKAITIMVWMMEEKHAHTDDVLAGLERDELRGLLLAEMHRISDMGARVRRAMMGIVADDNAAPGDRSRAAWVLAVMGPDAAEATPALLAALEGPDAEAPGDSVARSAARALARIGPAAVGAPDEHGRDADRTLERLDAASTDESLAFATRYTARVAAMCVRGDAASEAHAHAAMLRSEDPRVRLRAALGLRWVVDIREAGVAVRELATALGDEDRNVAGIARGALRALVVRDERYGQMLEEIAAGMGDASGAARVREVLILPDRK